MKLCWWCCHEIPGDIFEFPFKYDNGTFHLCGQFCGWSCIKAYNIYTFKSTTGRCSDTISLYRLKTTGEIGHIKTAPPRFSLQAFGGNLTIEEFRSGNFNVRLNTPEESFVKYKNAKTIEMNIETTDNDLVLKRTKPLKRDMSGIQKFLLKK